MSGFVKASWPRRLRSREWFEGTTRDNIYHRSWMKNQGLPPDLFDGRPVIGICNTWSQLTPCNAHLRDLAERVRHGIYEAGGLPLEFPVFSPGESALRPTAMLYRNLCAMDVEEALRANPIDGVVLLAGCDKTTPALLMGAASVDIPAILVSGGPMLNGWFRGERIGSGVAIWRMTEAVAAGTMSREDFLDAEASMSRSPGSCNTMGTASTMASMAEALGMALSGNAAIPAVDSRRRVMAHVTGRRIVEMVKDDLKPSDILTEAGLRERHPRQRRHRRLDQRRHPSPRHRRPGRGRPHARRLGPAGAGHPDHRRPAALGTLPHGGVLLRRRPAGGDPRPRRGGQAAPGRADRLRRRDLGRGQRRAQLERGGDPPGRTGAHPIRRDRRAAREPRARRGGAEALGRVRAPDAAPRAGGRLRGHRRLQGADRGRGPRHRRELRHGAEELRTARLSRHGRGRQHAASAQGAAQGDHRHGADLGRAHVRHRLRHGGAARRARGGARRPARGGARPAT